MVYGVFTRLSSWGPSSNPTIARHFCPSARQFNLHCHSQPRCIHVNWDPVGCKRYDEYIKLPVAQLGSLARTAPCGVEIVHCKCCPA